MTQYFEEHFEKVLKRLDVQDVEIDGLLEKSRKISGARGER